MAQLSYSLKESATIVRLSIRDWSGLKHDKEATKAAEAALGIKEGSGRFSKRLAAEERLKEISQIKNAARKFHYDNTLPWDDDSGRLLTTKNHMTYVTQMQVYEHRYVDKYTALVHDFPDLVEEAKADLGPRFNPDDYPEDIAARYSFKVTFAPITSADDFRCNLREDEINRIKAMVRDEEQEKIKAAMEDVWRRLFEVVKNLHERTVDKKAIFRDTLVTNIADLTDVLKRINVTGDAALEEMRREIESKFANIDPETLRKDEKVRKTVAKEADEIMSKMAAYYSPVATK